MIIQIYSDSDYNEPEWLTVVNNRLVELMGPGGAHPYYDDLCLEFIEYGIEPDRGTWRSRIIGRSRIGRRIGLEISMDDIHDHHAVALKLEFHKTKISGTTLVVEVN